MRTKILIRFIDVPDVDNTNAGWLCAPVNDKLGNTCGAGRTMREAFEDMLTRIENKAVEETMRTFGREVTK